MLYLQQQLPEENFKREVILNTYCVLRIASLFLSTYIYNMVCTEQRKFFI